MKSDTLADLAYFRALENAKKLNDQVEYFRKKESPRREEMVDLAMKILAAHMELVEQMRLDYILRKQKFMEKKS
jgi:hypothetical protein